MPKPNHQEQKLELGPASSTGGAARAVLPGLRLTAWAICFLMLSLTGCSGCFSTGGAQTEAEREAAQKKRQEELKKKKKKKVKPFEVKRVRVRPHTTDTEQVTVPALKPGHWASMVQEMKANEGDFHGEMEIGVVDKSNRPIYLDRTPFQLMTSRPAVLPKGQTKFLEMPVFIPHGSKQTRLATNLQGPGGAAVQPSVEFFNAMPSYQYFIVVLASESNRYGFLKSLDSVLAPHPDDSSDIVQSPAHYLVTSIEPGRNAPLPSYALAWTSVAYLIWDDVPPDSLTPEQQTALVDWLHWGGQLIISGPSSLDALSGSFLAPYLPVTAGKARDLVESDVRELSEYWTPRGKKKRDGKISVIPPISVASKWSGVELDLVPEREGRVQFVEKTNDLIAESQVGRGRVVVTAMRLDERELRNWNGYDGIFNACLLRRPSRKFSEDLGDIRVTWDKTPNRRRDARLTSNLSFFSRDIGTDTNYVQNTREEYDFYGGSRQIEEWSEPAQRGGVGAWNDLSETARVARQSLTEAAGIKVPKSSFVITILAAYLIVIVPVNWFIFQMIRRIEWAWIAAPIIALVCSVVVVRMAQLDIGFARAQTEISVLEMYDDYDRGHLSRYTALYTSLSTTYDLTFDDLSAVAQPLADPDFELLTGQSRSTVRYFRHQDVQLRDFYVTSNTTDMVHSEQMLKLPGGFEISPEPGWPMKLTNHSGFDVSDACLVYRGKDEFGKDYLAASWIGPLDAGATVDCEPGERELIEEMNRKKRNRVKKISESKNENLSNAEDDVKEEEDVSTLTRFLAEKRDTGSADALGEEKKLNLERLFLLAQNPEYFAPGEVRLIGRIDQPLDGMEVTPVAKQRRTATLLIAHLKADLPKPPQRDKNSRVSAAPVRHDGFSN